MVKKKLTAFALALMMLPSVGAIASEGNQVFIDLSVDADMFLKTTKNVTSSYKDDLYYYNGAEFAEAEFEINGIQYKP